MHPTEIIPLVLPQSQEAIIEAQGADNLARWDQVQAKSWLNQNHPLGRSESMDWQLFAQLAGDGFIAGTSLEGFETPESVAHFHAFVGQLLDKAGDDPDSLGFVEVFRPELERFQKEMAGAKTLNEEIEQLINNGKELSNEERDGLLGGLAKRLKAEVCDSQWISLGWSKDGAPNRGMMARIDMEKGEVTLVNSGDGIKAHHPAITETSQDPLTGAFKEETKFQEFVTIGEVNKRRLGSKTFWKFMLELRVRPHWDGQLNFDEENVYEPLKKYLKGKVRPALDPYRHGEVFKKPTRSETSATKAVSTTLYYTLCNAFEGECGGKNAVDCYKKIKYLWQTQALVDIACQVGDSITEPQHLLLEDVMANLSRASEKLYRKDLLDDDDLEKLQATLDDIREKLSNVQVVKDPSEPSEPTACAVDVLQKGLSSVVLPRTLLHGEPLDGMIESPRADRDGGGALTDLLQAVTEKTPALASFSEMTAASTLQDIIELFGSITEDEGLRSEYESLPGVEQRVVGRLLMQHLSTVICGLPMPTHAEDSLWKTLPEEEVVPVMRQISKLMTLVMQLNDKQGVLFEMHDAHTSIMAYALYAINAQLATRLSETKLEGFTLNYFDLLYEIKSPHFIVTDPGLQSQLDAMMRYFDPSFNLETLCQDVSADTVMKQSNALFAFKNGSRSDNYISQMAGRISFDKKSFKGCLKTNQTLQFYEKHLAEILSDPDRAEAFPRDTKLTADETKAAQLITLMTEKADMLPESVRLIQHSALLCSALHHSRSGGASGGIGLKRYEKADESDKCVGVETLSGKTHYYLKCRDDQTVVVEPGRNLQTIQRSSLIEDQEGNHRQNHYIPSRHELFDLPLDVSRELRMLGAEPYDEVARTAGFIKDHPNLLKHKEVQDIIRVHLFRAGRLASQLADEPAVVCGLSDAIEGAINHHLHLDDHLTCLYLAKLGNELQVYMEKHGCGLGLSSYRDIVRERIIPQFQGRDKVTAVAYATLVSFYDGVETSAFEENEGLLQEAAGDLLAFRAVCRTSRLSFVEKQEPVVRGVEMRLMPLVEGFSKDGEPDPSGVLNAILKAVVPTAQPAEWEGTFPNYQSADYRINAAEGTVEKLTAGAVTTLPYQILRNENFRKIFTGEVRTCTKRDDYTYIVNEGLDDELEITDARPLPPVFKRIIDGEVHVYLDKPFEWVMDAPSVFGCGTQCWLRQEGEGFELSVFNKEGATTAHGRLTRTEAGTFQLVRGTVYRDRADGHREYWTPFADTMPIEDLKLLEQDPRHIECWVVPNDQGELALSSVTLKRCGLSFVCREFDKQLYLTCQQFPGYHLVENPSVPSLSKTPRFFTLQNMAGERKVVVPRCRLGAGDAGGNIEQISSEKAAWVDYDLKDGDLTSKKVEAKLYLAYLYAVRRDFDKAFEVLGQITPLERFADNPGQGIMQETILNRLSQTLSAERHPAACAVSLQLAMMRQENSLRFPLAKGARAGQEAFSWSTLIDPYIRYYKNHTNTTSTRLSEKREKQLLGNILESMDRQIATGVADKGLVEQRKIILRLSNQKKGVRTLSFDATHDTPDRPLLHDWFPKFAEDAVNSEYELPPYLVQEEEFFEDSLVDLYHIARSGTKVQKAQLREILELSCAKGDSYHRLIDTVLRHPRLFPSIETISKFNAAKEQRRPSRLALLRHGLPTVISMVALEIFSGVVRRLSFDVSRKFSIRTRAYERFAGLFRERHRKAKKPAAGARQVLSCEGLSLQAADKAFDDYFRQLREKYFDSAEEPIEIPDDVLAAEGLDANVQKKLEEENTDLRAHRATLPRVRDVYFLREDASLEALKDELQATANNLSASLKAQKIALLWQLNHIPDHVAERSVEAAHKAGFHQQLTWRDLQTLTLEGSLDAFMAITHLGQDESERLLLGTADYLIKASRLEQLCQVKKTVEKGEGATDSKKRDLFVRSISSGLSLFRAYEPDESNLHRLWFEYANHYLYRKEQIDKLEEITASGAKETLAEMPTAFGKTKTVIPTLDYEKRRSGKLVINAQSGPHEMTNAVDLSERMEESFAARVDRLVFDRASDFTVAALKQLYSDLKGGGMISIRSESLRALELHALLKLMEAEEEGSDERIELFLKILRLIRTESWMTIDESHITLNPRDKLVYANGTSETLPKEQVELIEDVFDLLTKGAFGDEMKLAQNGQTLVDAQRYRDVIAPKLAECFRESLGVSDERQESYEDFVLGKKGEIPAWLEEHPNRGQVALMKGLLTQVMPACIKGSVDADYGLSKLHGAKIEYAIAYAYANTPKETASNPSQYKNPHETMAKTYITYLHKGLSKGQVEKLVSSLQKEAMAEADSGGSLEHTAANALFQEIVQDPDRLLMKVKPADIEALYPQMYMNKQAIFYYVKNKIAPKLDNYTETLVSTGQNFKSQASESFSDSATTQARVAHGIDTHFIPMLGTSGQVTHLLLTKCKTPETLHGIDGIGPDEVVDETLSLMESNPQIHAAMDVGAHCKGLSNVEVARRMQHGLKVNGNAQAILFFDEDAGLFKIMDVLTGEVYDPAECELDPETVQTFYDQSRSFGSDIKQAVDAVGLLMTGQGTTKAVAGQGAGRMREWDQDQSAQVTYPNLLKDEIFGTDAPSIEKLLVYWLKNQTRAEEDNTYEDLKQQMDNEVRRALLDKILGLEVGGVLKDPAKKVDVSRAIRLFKKFKSEFVSHESYDPWTLYAGIPEDESAVTSLEQHQEQSLEKSRKLKGLTRRERRYITGRLEKYPAAWKDIALPEKVRGKSAGLGMECEVLQEVDVEVYPEPRVQDRPRLKERTPAQWPEKLDLFSKGWERPKKAHLFLRSVPRKLISWVGETRSQRFDNTVWVGLVIGAIASVPAVLAAAVVVAVPGAMVVVALAASGVALAILEGTVFVGMIVASAGAVVAAYAGGIGLTFGVVEALAYLAGRVQKGNGVYRVKDLMSHYLPRKVRKGARVFSPNFTVSNNFWAQKSQSLSVSPQKPLDVEQKPLYSVLVICDEERNGAKAFQVMAIDLNDNAFFHRKLKEDNEAEGTQERSRKVGLYDLHTGQFTIQGKNRFDEGELRDPELQKLFAQAKFLDGQINYTDVEMDQLQDHLGKVATEVGHNVLQMLALDHILKEHPSQRECMDNLVFPKPLALALGLGQ